MTQEAIDQALKPGVVTPEDEANLGGPEGTPNAATRPAQDAGPRVEVPHWFPPLPQGLRVPPGRNVMFVRFRKEWTETPWKGERFCLVWTLSDADERLAYKVAAGESERIPQELAKLMIRVIDGARVSSDGDPAGDVNTFWREIGAKGRHALQRIYQANHSFTEEEKDDFFLNCVVSVTSTG